MKNGLDDKVMNNINTCKKIISLTNQIKEHLNKDIIKEGQPIIILEKYEWLREVLSLLSKQSNLFESCTLLLENNMEQEAYILARSQFNNMLWISYLCNDSDNKRVKEYFYEPHITHLQQLINIKKYIKTLTTDSPFYGKFPDLSINEINKQIKKIKEILGKEGYDLNTPNRPVRNKKIIDLTEGDSLLLGLYNTFYNESSKYEHADISTTKSYRKSADDDVSIDVAFILDLSKSDIKLWKEVFSNSLTILFLAINKIFERINNNEEHLFEFEQFKEADFASIIVNIKIATDILDTMDV